MGSGRRRRGVERCAAGEDPWRGLGAVVVLGLRLGSRGPMGFQIEWELGVPAKYLVKQRGLSRRVIIASLSTRTTSCYRWHPTKRL